MSFLLNYLNYTSDNEAPKIFHRFSGIGALSALAGRRVWIQQGIFTFYPNMYIALVGGPGTGKTTAMSVAKNIIRDVGCIPICPTAVTKEKICQFMAASSTTEKPNPCKRNFSLGPGHPVEEYTQFAVFATEISHFLGANAMHMVDFLTTIFDEVVYESGTKNKGDDLIIGPYLTLLGCITPATTNSFMQQSVISGGFARRTIFVLALEREKAVPEPMLTPEMIQSQKDCVAWGKELQNVKGPFTWTTEAKTWYNKWYIALRSDKKKLSDPIIGYYFESKHVQLLKMAMLLQLSESKELVLTLPILQLALAFLDEAEINLPKVFSGVGRNEQAGIAAKIVDYLTVQNRLILKRKVISDFFREAPIREIEDILMALRRSDEVDELEFSVGENPPQKYIGLTALVQQKRAELQSMIAKQTPPNKKSLEDEPPAPTAVTAPKPTPPTTGSDSAAVSPPSESEQG